MLFTASDLVTRLGGELLGPDVQLDGVSIDSRSVVPGNLFVPIEADRDGHEFVPAAVRAGAAGYLTARGRIDEGATAIAVDDTGEALTELGRIARVRLTGPVIAITGSVGKTSVKDLTAAACGRSRRTHASERSFNNELGVPLTLGNAPEDTEVTVVEMGARGPGHIAELCEIGRPTVGVVTAVALAHSELFGTIESVAEAKGELIEALPADGTAVLNADQPLVAAMAKRTSAPALTFGVDGGEVRATDVVLDGLLRPSFRLETPWGPLDVELAARGAHMALNAAGAAAAALAAGIELDAVGAGLRGAGLSPWRMEVTRTAGGLIVINDAYNANPTSMRAAMRALVAVDAGERVAVLGEMAELGDEGPAEHRAIAEEAAAEGIRVLAVGAPAYGPRAEHYDDRATAVAALGSPGDGVAILVKGSRVAGLEALAAELIAGGH